MRSAHLKNRTNSPRCRQLNRQNPPNVISSAGVPQYVSIRHRRYGLRHGVSR